MINRKTENNYIHPTAIIYSNNIGKNNTIWQYTVILENAIIGNNCNFCAHTFVESEVNIGNNVTIKSGVFLWDGITIHDNVFIGPNVTFTNDIKPRSKKYKNPVKTTVEKGASLGANCSILAGITIGKYAMVGMGAVITKNVPDYALVYGNPGKIKGWVDEAGNKLKKISGSEYKSVNGKTFLLFENKMKVKR